MGNYDDPTSCRNPKMSLRENALKKKKKENAFTWAPATPTRSRQSGLCMTGRVGCTGNGGVGGPEFHKTAYGGKCGTVGAQRISRALEGRGRKGALRERLGREWCVPTVGHLPMVAYQRILGSSNNRLHLLSTFS